MRRARASDFTAAVFQYRLPDGGIWSVRFAPRPKAAIERARRDGPVLLDHSAEVTRPDGSLSRWSVPGHRVTRTGALSLVQRQMDDDAQAGRTP